MLETVLQYGTARAASLGQFAAGKTGTTSNYGDAWFIGWDDQLHRRRVGRLPQPADPDDHPVRRQPGARRHVPRADLAQLHGLRDADRQGPRRTGCGAQGRKRGTPAPRARAQKNRYPPHTKDQAAPRTCPALTRAKNTAPGHSGAPGAREGPKSTEPGASPSPSATPNPSATPAPSTPAPSEAPSATPTPAAPAPKSGGASPETGGASASG